MDNNNWRSRTLLYVKMSWVLQLHYQYFCQMSLYYKAAHLKACNNVFRVNIVIRPTVECVLFHYQNLVGLTCPHRGFKLANMNLVRMKMLLITQLAIFYLVLWGGNAIQFLLKMLENMLLSTFKYIIKD